MKKISKKQYNYLKAKQLRKQKAEKRFANTYKHYERLERKKLHLKLIRKSIERQRLRKNTQIFKGICKEFTFNKAPKVVNIEGEFGLEEEGAFNLFLDLASQAVHFNSIQLTLNMTKCTRIWPSAVTFLCSLAQWAGLIHRSSDRPPKLYGVPPEDKKVNSYLHHSGFYEYISIHSDDASSYYPPNEVVKIHRELHKSNIEKREEELMSLLEEHSDYTIDELELFDSGVLTEIFNNVTEHGISYRDRGWWVLAQYHKRHKMISLCIADNGIGFKNNLLSGPQGRELQKKHPELVESEGELIKFAFKPNVSGAYSASVKDKKFFQDKFRSGERRGNGLVWISDVCNQLKIRLTILSHFGYFQQGLDGSPNVHGIKNNRVFAGTMYHLTIPAK